MNRRDFLQTAAAALGIAALPKVSQEDAPKLDLVLEDVTWRHVGDDINDTGFFAETDPSFDMGSVSDWVRCYWMTDDGRIHVMYESGATATLIGKPAA